MDFKEGISLEQKRALVKKVTDAFTSTLGVKEENVQIIISEFKKENYAKGGILNIDRNL